MIFYSLPSIYIKYFYYFLSFLNYLLLYWQWQVIVRLDIEQSVFSVTFFRFSSCDLLSLFIIIVRWMENKWRA